MPGTAISPPPQAPQRHKPLLARVLLPFHPPRLLIPWRMTYCIDPAMARVVAPWRMAAHKYGHQRICTVSTCNHFNGNTGCFRTPCLRFCFNFHHDFLHDFNYTREPTNGTHSPYRNLLMPQRCYPFDGPT